MSRPITPNPSFTSVSQNPPPRDYLDLTAGVRDESSVQLLREILTTSRKIVVLAGAGISVAAGIPDFRSSKGLFASMKAKGRTGQAMFDSSVYRTPSTVLEFHDMICSLHEASQSCEPTPFHNLLERLAQSDRLMRLYTQNIDSLECRTGRTTIPLPASGPWPKVIQVHGSLAKMTCTKCRIIKDFNPQYFRIWKEDWPECIDCAKDEEARIAAGRRKTGVGFIRPRMVLYGEPGYDDLNIGSCMAADLRSRPDTLIVVGTTLKIPGTKTMVREMARSIGNRGHVIWLNISDAPSGEFDDVWDFVIKGDCQDVAKLMEEVTISHKDQSFIDPGSESIPASQQTVQDVATNRTLPRNDWWSVVVDGAQQAKNGLLTPASTNPTCSDDDVAIKKSKKKVKCNIDIQTTKPDDFYKPLNNFKSKSLKRKRSRLESTRPKISEMKQSKVVKATSTADLESTKAKKRTRTSKQSKIVKLKLPSPKSVRTVQEGPICVSIPPRAESASPTTFATIPEPSGSPEQAGLSTYAIPQTDQFSLATSPALPADVISTGSDSNPSSIILAQVVQASPVTPPQGDHATIHNLDPSRLLLDSSQGTLDDATAERIIEEEIIKINSIEAQEASAPCALTEETVSSITENSLPDDPVQETGTDSAVNQITKQRQKKVKEPVLQRRTSARLRSSLSHDPSSTPTPKSIPTIKTPTNHPSVPQQIGSATTTPKALQSTSKGTEKAKKPVRLPTRQSTRIFSNASAITT